jgi:hypothetical protein
VDGQNVRIEQRWAEGHDDRLPALIADLVRQKVAVRSRQRQLQRLHRSSSPLVMTQLAMSLSLASTGPEVTSRAWSLSQLCWRRSDLSCYVNSYPTR